MSDTSSGNEWELVTDSLSSHQSLSSDDAAHGGTVASNVRSGYFATPANVLKPVEVDPATGVEDDAASVVEEIPHVEVIDLIPVSDELPKLASPSSERKLVVPTTMNNSSSGIDWELVTGTLSSHESFSASSSADAAAAAAKAAGDGGTADSNVLSDYFGTPKSMGIGTEKLKPVEDDDTYAAVEDIPLSKQVEEIDFSRGILVSESCHELSKLDWMEPRSPGHQLLDYEGSGFGSSTSNSDSHAPEIKDGLEPNSHQMGPLLGACLPGPISPTIVSRDNSFRRLNLPDEMVGEVEPDTLASAEHEMLLVHSAFISPNSFGADMDKMGVPLEESALRQERASEIWWNKQAALRGVHGRQANTYWSIALAAAVMGLVILGHRWQYERRQNQHLRLRLHLKEEKIGQLVLQLARMKEMLSGRRRVPVLRSNYGSYERY